MPRVTLNFPCREGKPGDTVDVSDSRARQLRTAGAVRAEKAKASKAAAKKADDKG